MTIAWPAVVAVARAERARRRRGMVAIGLAAGLAGGLVVGGAALFTRTASAPERLLTAVDPGDAHVQVFGGPELAAEIVALPGVVRSATMPIAVGRLDGPFVRYAGVAALDDGSLLSPVLLDGRRPAAGADDEAMLTEAAARELGLGAGDRLRLSLLTIEEFTQFDTGFGEPDGATVELLVTGVARLPPGLFDGTPILAGSGFGARHTGSVVGSDLFLELEDGSAGFADFSEAVADVAAAAAPTAASEEFLPAAVDDPRAGTRAIERSTRVLLGGLLAAVVIAALASLLALTQALARHHGSSAGQQRIESALGMTAFERVAARTLPWLGPALLAGLVAATLALLGASIDPVGPLSRVEPDRDWRPETGVIVVGALGVTLVLMAATAATAWWAGRRHRSSAQPRRAGSALAGLAPRRNGWTMAGTVFALSSSGGGADSPARVRTSLAGCVVGVAGLVGAITFAATLDRLLDTPARYGWSSDMAIADAQDELFTEIVGDSRFDTVVDVMSARVQVDGRARQAYSFTPVLGVAGWTYVEGHSPQWSGEVAIGSRLADSLGLEIGDHVDIAGAGSLEVVGIGFGPPLNGEPLGSSVLLDSDALAEASVDALFREALLSVSRGVDASAVAAELATRYELTERSLPAEVRDVADLGRLPELLGAFLAFVGIAAIAHTIVVTASRRARDLAVLRALGATPGQSGLAVVAMAIATMCFGLALGAPLGWACARLVWGMLADSVGIEPGVVLPPSIVLVVLGGLTIAVALAAWPARRISRADPAAVLRAE